MKIRKINARITPEVDRKLREIIAATGSNMSKVLMDAIERYYQQGPVKSAESPYSIAKSFGLIGSFKSKSGDLSVDYKQIISKELNGKYGNRR